MKYKLNKRGLNAIIAMLLLLMMTIAAASAAFYWFVQIQSELQGGTEAYTEKLSETVSALVKISDVNILSDESIKMVLHNVGNADIPMGKENLVWILKDRNQNVVCTQTFDGNISSENKTFCQDGCAGDLRVKEIRTIVINLTNSSNECYLGTYANESLFYFKIDFGGITQSADQFKKSVPY